MVLAGSGCKPAESVDIVQWKEKQVGSEQLAKELSKHPPLISQFSTPIQEVAEDRPLASPCLCDVISCLDIALVK